MSERYDATPQVLVVDDDRDMRDLLAEITSYAGCRPFRARSAAKALSVLESEKVDLMILDLYMPGGNGVDLLNTLKRRYLDVPTMVVSGYVSTSVLKQLVALGVKGVVAKPFDVGRLMVDIKRQLGVFGYTARLKASCRFCDNPVSENHRFCMHCGRPRQETKAELAECVPA